MESKIHELLLERYALGELPPERMAEIEATLAKHPAERARLEALRADNADFLAAHPPERVVPQLLYRARPEPTRARWTWAVAPILAAAIAAFVLVPDSTPSGASPPEAAPTEAAPLEAAPLEDARTKGGPPRLHVFRRASGHSELLASGAHARAGDLLQLAYVAGGGAYGVIVSIDGGGTVTPQLGSPGGEATPLVRGGDASLDKAYELDGAPGFERFFLVTSDTSFAVAPVVAAARALAADPARAVNDPLSLPSGLDQTSVTLLKEHP